MAHDSLRGFSIPTLQRLHAAYARERPLFFAPLRSLEGALLEPWLADLPQPWLDYGCGDGFFARQLAGARGFEWGLEPDARARDAAERSGAYRALIDLPQGRIPLPDGAVGGLLCNSVLEHVADPEGVFAEWARVLRPGGCCLCTITLIDWQMSLPGPLRPLLNRVQRHASLRPAQAWMRLATTSGFDILTAERYAPPVLARRVLALHVPAAPLWLLHRVPGAKAICSQLGHAWAPARPGDATSADGTCLLLVLRRH